MDGTVFGPIAVRNHSIDLAVIDQHLIVLPVRVDVVWPGEVVFEDPEASALEQGRVAADFSRDPRKRRLAHDIGLTSQGVLDVSPKTPAWVAAGQIDRRQDGLA